MVRPDRICVRIVLRQLRESVVQVLGRLTHRRRGRIDQPFGDEARVVVDVLEHRVPPHVLDSAGEDDVGGAHRDLARSGGDRGQRPRAHPIDREARNRPRQAGQQGDVAAERQALVAHLSGRGEYDVVDSLRRQRAVPAQQLAHELDGNVVGTRAPEHTARSGPAEGAANPVDVVDLAELAHVDKASG